MFVNFVATADSVQRVPKYHSKVAISRYFGLLENGGCGERLAQISIWRFYNHWISSTVQCKGRISLTANFGDFNTDPQILIPKEAVNMSQNLNLAKFGPQTTRHI